METAGNWLAWLVHRAMWLQVVWLLAACAIGIPWIIRDEIRFRRTAPKPAEVAAYADQLEAAHGSDALRAVGRAMNDARKNGNFQTRRFLKEVSAELVRRQIDGYTAEDPDPENSEPSGRNLLPSGLPRGYT
jgi:hypothetical protein